MWSQFWHTLGQLKTVNLWYLWIFSRCNLSVEIGSEMVPSVFNCTNPVPSVFHCWTEKAVGITTITSGFHLRQSETLRSLRHYQWAHCQGHHTINCLEETGVQRGNTWWSFFKRWELKSLSSVRLTLELFQRQDCGNLWESVSGPSWARGYCLELTWTQLMMASKLQVLVYDIPSSTTAIWTTKIKQGVSFIAADKVYTSTNKTTMVWIETELFFFFTWWMRLMFTWVLWRWVASTVILVPKPFGGRWLRRWTAVRR